MSPCPNLRFEGLKWHHVELVLRGHLVLGRGVDSPHLSKQLGFKGGIRDKVGFWATGPRAPTARDSPPRCS